MKKEILNMPVETSVNKEKAKDICNKILNILEAEEINQDDKLIMLASMLLGVVETKFQSHFDDIQFPFYLYSSFANGLINTIIEEISKKEK